MTQKSGRKPDYCVGLLNKRTDEKNGFAGGAWKNEDGTISIVLDSFIEIRGGRDMLITLFPKREDG